MQKLPLFFVIMICAGMISCEKVIDIKIKDSDSKYVIEGVISDQAGSCKLLLSQTVKFSDPNVFPGVSGATVTVKDNGVTSVLTETSRGVYETGAVIARPGHIYELTVVIGSQTFTATSRMQAPVPIDTVIINRGPFGAQKFAYVYYTDPAGINNGYRFIQYVNGRKDPAIFWDNDEFTDGQRTAVLLDNGVTDITDARSIKSGDVVLIELLSLDDPIYHYWSSLIFGGADGSGYTASPSNPVTNIVGGALGYFSAHSVSQKIVIAP
jgi:hypothetical protein